MMKTVQRAPSGTHGHWFYLANLTRHTYVKGLNEILRSWITNILIWLSDVHIIWWSSVYSVAEKRQTTWHCFWLGKTIFSVHHRVVPCRPVCCFSCPYMALIHLYYREYCMFLGLQQTVTYIRFVRLIIMPVLFNWLAYNGKFIYSGKRFRKTAVFNISAW